MAIECARCKAPNPDGKRFCGDCGAPLDIAAAATGMTLQQQVGEVIRERYKDQKIVEVETAQAIATRLFDWAKLLAFFIGIPIALALFLLGLLGIKTYSDFTHLVERAQQDVTGELKAAQTGAAKLRTEGEALAGEYEKLRARLADTSALAVQVDALSRKVDVIGEKLGFSPTSNVSPDLKGRLEEAFGKFQQYVHQLGYRSTSDRVELHIDDELPKQHNMIAYYDPAKKRMVIDSKYVADPVILYREYMHHVLIPSGMPGDGGANGSAYVALESGLAWYFPCSFVDNPRPSPRAALWDLTRKRAFSELQRTHDSALRSGTEIWGSAFWELRQRLGAPAVDKLLLEAWFKLRSEPVVTDPGPVFVKKLLDLGNAHQAQIRAVFVERGLAL